jgi:hypothetical protein
MICLLQSPIVMAAGPRPGCQTPVFSQMPVDSIELRAIATSCPPGPIADLWYNRAYHAELLQRYRSAMQLEVYRPQDDVRNYHSYRIFIDLSEAMAEHTMSADSLDTVVWLNSIYDRAGEIAEMRLRGYDLQADRLEARLWSE